MRVLFLLISIAFATNAMAMDMYDQLFDKANQVELEKQEQLSAIKEAKKFTTQSLKNLKLKSDALPKQKPRKITKKSDIVIKKASAPFGLVWGSSIDGTKGLGVKLSPYAMEDVTNSFEATLLPKPLKDFNKVIVVFGSADTLWRVFAYGDFIADDSSASVGLAEYQKYYKMLEKKYGNANQRYIAAKKTIIEIVKKEEIKTIVDEEIGNKNFLSQLESGEAVLYANFNNSEVGVALSLNADGSGQTYIAIDYNNINFLDQEQEKTIDAL